MLLLEHVDGFEVSKEALFIPRVAGVMNLLVGPCVGEKDLSGIGTNVGESIKDVSRVASQFLSLYWRQGLSLREVFRWDEGRRVLSPINAPRKARTMRRVLRRWIFCIGAYQLTKLFMQDVTFRSPKRQDKRYTHYPTLYFPFPGMVGVFVEELSGLGLGVPVLMSPPRACCGSLTDHWPAL